jgi:hypothetical protein
VEQADDEAPRRLDAERGGALFARHRAEDLRVDAVVEAVDGQAADEGGGVVPRQIVRVDEDVKPGDAHRRLLHLQQGARRVAAEPGVRHVRQLRAPAATVAEALAPQRVAAVAGREVLVYRRHDHGPPAALEGEERDRNVVAVEVVEVPEVGLLYPVAPPVRERRGEQNIVPAGQVPEPPLDALLAAEDRERVDVGRARLAVQGVEPRLDAARDEPFDRLADEGLRPAQPIRVVEESDSQWPPFPSLTWTLP